MVEPLTKEQARAFDSAYLDIRRKLEQETGTEISDRFTSALFKAGWNAARTVAAPAQVPQAGVNAKVQEALKLCVWRLKNDHPLRVRSKDADAIALGEEALALLTKGPQTSEALDGWTIEQWAKAAREREAMLKALESEWKRVKPLIEPVWPQT